MEEIVKIINEIKANQLKPIYFLMGDEPFFIDKLTDYIEQNVLAADQKDFNQTILYGREVSMEDIISAAKRYPMMSDRQVVIVKEAQELSKTIEKLELYAENPMPSTVLVFCYKYKSLDKRKKIYKNIDKNGLIFESKKLYDNQVGTWIDKILKTKKIAIEPKATEMLVEFLGNDLSRIYNEIEKLALILPKDSPITSKIIEDNIGISKDFNVFELRSALGTKNIAKSYQIVQYFANNPKENNISMVIGLLYAFFVQLLKYHGAVDRSPAGLSKLLGINPFFLKDYEVAARNYPLKKVSQMIETLKNIDLKSKGVGASALPLPDLYKQLLIDIFKN